MTNCEECVYFEYDPETDTNYCEADLDEMIWRNFSAPPTMPAPFTAPETNTALPGGSEFFPARHEGGQACIL